MGAVMMEVMVRRIGRLSRRRTTGAPHAPDLIRTGAHAEVASGRSLGKSELRAAVSATTRGWKAKVYPETRDNAPWLQALVEQ